MAQPTLHELFISAARDGDLGELKKLLGRGADPRFNHSKALVEAAKGTLGDNEQCIAYLLSHCDPTARDFLALHTAIINVNRMAISLLLPSFTGFNNEKRQLDSLEAIIRIGDAEGFGTLLSLCTVTTGFQDPIMTAVIYRQKDFVAKLLQKMDTSRLDMKAFSDDLRDVRDSFQVPGEVQQIETCDMVQSFLESLILQKQLPARSEVQNKSSKNLKSL